MKKIILPRIIFQDVVLVRIATTAVGVGLAAEEVTAKSFARGIGSAKSLIVTFLPLALGVVNMAERGMLFTIRLPALLVRQGIHLGELDGVLWRKKHVVWDWVDARWEWELGRKTGL
jgi:hypothetical protein